MRRVTHHPRFRAFRLLVAGFSVTAAVAAATAAHAGEPDTLRSQASSLDDANAALGQRANAALLELYALETGLGRAAGRVADLQGQAAVVEAREAAARSRLGIVRHAASVAQQQLGDRLTALYVEGDVDPLAVLLGAGSLDEAISAVDAINRLAAEDERIIAAAGRTRSSLRAALGDLEREASKLQALVAGAEAARQALSEARDEKAGYLAELTRRRELNAAEIDSLSAQAVAAEQQSAEIAATAAAGAVPVTVARVPSDSSPSAEGQLTVDAVAYSLPGYTASGLPVGKGVVAVDPSVIPLGTRLYVPGYGPAVAADVGTAIIGRIIDLWFPTYEQAAVWGRRTVTITIYG